jgi:hypothetical protein
MAWALLALLNSAGLPTLLSLAAIFYCATTFIATMWWGEHYLVDLVVAFPLAVGVQAMALRFFGYQGTAGALSFAAIAIASWLSLLCTQVDLFLKIPFFTILMVIITIAFSLIFGIKMFCQQLREAVPAATNSWFETQRGRSEVSVTSGTK